MDDSAELVSSLLGLIVLNNTIVILADSQTFASLE